MSTIKQLGKIPKGLTKYEIESLAQADLKAVIEDEQYDLLKMYIELKRYDIYLSKLISSSRQHALKQAKALGNSSFDYAQAKIRVSTRTVYSYKDDAIWKQLQEGMKSIQEQIRTHQEFLKGLELNTEEVLNKSTGELVTVTKPKKRIDISFSISI